MEDGIHLEQAWMLSIYRLLNGASRDDRSIRARLLSKSNATVAVYPCLVFQLTNDVAVKHDMSILYIVSLQQHAYTIE